MKIDKKKIIIFGAIVLLVVIIGIVIFFATKNNSGDDDTSSGKTEEKCGIVYTYPDEENLGYITYNNTNLSNSESIEISIENTCDEKKIFNLFLVRLTETIITDEKINYEIQVLGDSVKDTGTVNSLRAWLLDKDSKEAILNKTNKQVASTYLLVTGEINAHNDIAYKLSLNSEEDLTEEDTYYVTFIALETE